MPKTAYRSSFHDQRLTATVGLDHETSHVAVTHVIARKLDMLTLVRSPHLVCFTQVQSIRQKYAHKIQTCRKMQDRILK